MSDTPELRSGPPWAMEEMIAAEPELVAPILGAPEAAEAGRMVRAAVEAGEPVVLVGCGTSEHAALGGAEMLREALGAPAIRARDAFEAALDPQEGGVIVGISHEGGTAATLEAMSAARERGARAILVTARPDGVADGPLVVPTPLRDRSWCHTVGYMSPLLALHAMAGGTDPDAARQALAGVEPPNAAATLSGCERLLAVGCGADEVTARELALKIEEGVHVPVTPLGLEKLLHGHLPATDARTGLILLRFDHRRGDRRDARARQAAAAAAAIGLPTVTVSAPAPPGLPPAAGALLTGALALQLLTLELVHAAGTNPDLIRREEAPYRDAAAASGT